MFTISAANGIHFVKDNGLFPSQENTLSCDEKFGNYRTIGYIQRFDDSDVATVQCVSDTATLPTVTVYEDNAQYSITPSLVKSYAAASRYIIEFNVNYALYSGKFSIKAEKDGVAWNSEDQIADDMITEVNDGRYLKIEYTNSDHPSDFTNFQIDYTTDIEMFFYVESVLRKPNNEVEEDNYKNQDTQELIEFQMFRGALLETSPIPRFLMNKIMIASGSFLFVINNLAYKSKGDPSAESNSTNQVLLTLPVIEQYPLALSTDDRGITFSDVDYFKFSTTTTPKSSIWSFTLEEEYMAHVIYAWHDATSIADYTFKVGLTPGGDELLSDFTGAVELSTGTKPIPFTLHHFDGEGDTTIYVTITGVGAQAMFRVVKPLSKI